MPRLVAVGSALPEHRISQADAARFAGELFRGRLPRLDQLLAVFENSGIDQRYFVQPLDWFRGEHGLAEKNRTYIEAATQLSARSALACLEQAGKTISDVDCVLYVNTTGIATPSIDARLINVLGLSHHVRRVPIWGLGCAGGAAGLSHAYHHALGHPKDCILLIATELCGLTFLADDFSKSNLVATALFADGSAAALVVGDEVDVSGHEIVATRSTLYPDSLDVMGWNVLSHGLQVVFDRRIPDLIHANGAAEREEFLASCGVTTSDVKQHLYHPGGAKVLAAYQDVYGLDPSDFRYSHETLRQFGNMSSCTVLHVIEQYLRDAPTDPDGYALISALGPGFSSESLLMELTPSRPTPGNSRLPNG